MNKIENFAKNWPKLKFFENLTKIEIFFLKIDQNRNFRKFDQIRNLSKIEILTKIEIFRNFNKKIFDQNRKNLTSKFFENLKFRNFSKISKRFSIILTKIEIFRNFDRNRNFSKCRPKSKILFKSKFFEHLTKIRNFFFFFKLSKIEIFKNWTKIEICRKILLKSKFFRNFD